MSQYILPVYLVYFHPSHQASECVAMFLLSLAMLISLSCRVSNSICFCLRVLTFLGLALDLLVEFLLQHLVSFIQNHVPRRAHQRISEVSVLQSVSLNDLSNYILIANQIQEEFRGVLPTLPFPSLPHDGICFD